MAQKRMFDKRVVESDKFTDLPNSSKALYFLAGMAADDKGFFQPRRLQKMHGFTDDDFKILIAKNYFIPFESGVIVITDWNKNNWLDNRRITETEYIDELNLLKLINERYELTDEKTNSAKPMLSENRIEENRINNNMSGKIEEIIAYLNKPDTDEAVRSFKSSTKNTRSIISSRLKEGFTIDDFKDVIFFKYNQWVVKPYKFNNGVMSDTYYRPDTLFNSRNFENYLQEYKEKSK